MSSLLVIAHSRNVDNISCMIYDNQTPTYGHRAACTPSERPPGARKPRNLKRSRGPVAEDGGFEPPRACTQHAFQACAIGH